MGNKCEVYNKQIIEQATLNLKLNRYTNNDGVDFAIPLPRDAVGSIIYTSNNIYVKLDSDTQDIINDLKSFVFHKNKVNSPELCQKALTMLIQYLIIQIKEKHCYEPA